MELYKELAALRCFTHDDMVQLAGSESSAVWQIKSYLQKGYIERVRRNLYAVISMETGQAIPNRYQIASRVTDDACVSHHSAFEYYGYANQVFYDVYFTTEKRVRPFSYDGVNYCPMACRGNADIIKIDTGIRVTSLERTVIDSIADFEKIGGLEELLRCLLLIPSLDCNKLTRWNCMAGRSYIKRPDIFLKYGKRNCLYRNRFLRNVKNGLLPVKPIFLKSRAILSFITDGNYLLQRI